MGTEDLVLAEHGDSVTLLTINRPKALNAINPALVEVLGRALAEIPPSSRAVVVTGAGEKAFVAGADIKAMADFTAIEGQRFSRDLHALGERMESMDVPVIAAVNGFALGGGCELLLSCDFAIASDNARFGLPEVGLGVIPGFGGTTRLVRRVGDARARQLIFTGAHVDAAEALRIGLVNEVVPQPELVERAKAIAGQIAKNAPLALALAKRSVRNAEETDLKSANLFEMHAFGMAFSTEDQKEGMKAFVDKRAPQWKGQ